MDHSSFYCSRAGKAAGVVTVATATRVADEKAVNAAATATGRYDIASGALQEQIHHQHACQNWTADGMVSGSDRRSLVFPRRYHRDRHSCFECQDCSATLSWTHCC